MSSSQPAALVQLAQNQPICSANQLDPQSRDVLKQYVAQHVKYASMVGHCSFGLGLSLTRMITKHKIRLLIATLSFLGCGSSPWMAADALEFCLHV